MAKDAKSLILGHTFKSNRPYRHQVRALHKALTLDKGCALMMEPGTGKTRVAIDFAAIKHMNSGLDKVFVVAPKIALGVWEDQIDEYLTTKIDRQVITLSKEDIGTVDDRINELRGHRKVDRLTFVLVNYDVIYKMKQAIIRWSPKFVVADESHFIKNYTSHRSRAMHSIGATTRWRMALSGTYITNSPLDVFSQFKFVDSSLFGTRWTDFKSEFAIYGGFSGFKLLRYKNLDKMQEMVATRGFSATKDEMDLPPRTIQPLHVDMDAKTRKIYKQMEKEMVAELDEMGNKATAAIILTKILRLSQITGGFTKRSSDGEWVSVGTEKVKAVRELLEQYVIEGGNKVVIFHRFKPEEKAVVELCQSMGIGVIADRGLKEDRKRFQTDSKYQVYVVSLSRGGIAVNELVAANIGIFYSLDSSSDHWIQALDRLHRPGQVNNVFYPHLLMRGTIDEDIFEALNDNKEIADYVMHKMRRRNK